MSTTTARHQIPNLPKNFPRMGHVLPAFRDTLLGLGPICDADCQVTFDKDAMTIHGPDGRVIITGWRDNASPHLWRISLLPEANKLLKH